MIDENMFFDRQGNPTDVYTWGLLFEDYDARTLARTRVGAHHTVMTMWLGTNDEDADPPTIYGSIVKTDQHYYDEIRTATERDALLAHERLVERMQQFEAQQDRQRTESQSPIRHSTE